MQFGIHIHKTASKNKLYIYVSLFGMLIRIPVHTNKKSAKKVKPPAKDTNSLKRAFSFESFQENVKALSRIVNVSRREILDMLSYVRKNLSCKEIDFRIAFGMENAAKTGISTGAVWTTGTMLLKVIDSLIGAKKMNMEVYPDFQNKRFEISFKTILIMQPFRFIIVYRKIRNMVNFIKTNISNFK